MQTDPSTWGYTDTGFVRPPLADLIERYMDQFEIELQQAGIADWRQVRNPTNVLYILVAAQANVMDSTYGVMERLWQQMQANTATGLALDAAAGLVRVTRLAAAPSLVRLTLTGTAGIVIPAGTRFRGPALGLYALNEAVTIGVGGTVEGLCTSVSPGDWPIVDPVAIVNPIFGLDSAAVAAPYSPGRLTETDPELRLRYRATDSRFVAGRGTENAIRASLRAVPGVTAVDVISNRQDIPDGEGRPAHSFEAIIYPSIDATRVGPVLLFHQPAGVGETVGTQTWETVDDSGTERTLRWNVADAVPMKVQITGLSVESGSAAEYTTAIRTAVAAFVNALQVGETVSYARLVAAIVAVDGVSDASLIELAKVSGSFGTTGVVMTYREKATIADADTQVTFA